MFSCAFRDFSPKITGLCFRWCFNEIIQCVIVDSGWSSTDFFILVVQVNSRCLVIYCRPTVPVCSSRVDRIRRFLLFSKEVIKIVTVIDPCNSRIFLSGFRYVDCVSSRQRVAARVFNWRFAICMCFTFTRGYLGVWGGFFAFRYHVQYGIFTVPSFTLMVSATTYFYERMFSAVEREGCYP